ncbi:NAD(P)/FAD-dependent oxidoreductase [Mycolicibacterium sp.]|uniref:NAD(P)/FAD-dependent oxidoreductase n=1 Tax=Mycolicibacterium sp. TaxID=2320850 RepID=UPI003D0E03B1
MSPTFVTVGAGQTAAVAARTLRRRGFDGRIVLIGDEAHRPYQRPGLSKEFLAGTEPAAALAILRDDWIADNDIEIRTGTVVHRVDPATRTVELGDGTALAADAVLFATGGRPRMLDVPGPRPELVHYVRTLDDAQRLRSVLTPGARLAVVGAGFIGLEIAATATTLGVDVTVVEAAPVPLAGVLGAEMGEQCARLHRDRGVRLHTGVPVAAVRTTNTGVVVETSSGTTVEADAVMVGIGIVPEVTAARASGLAVDDGIVVDAAGQTSVPGVFAAGDVARRFSTRAGRHVRMEHFDNANKQGAAVANAMIGRDAVSDEAGWFWSDQYEHNLQLVGVAAARHVIRGSVADREFAAFYLDGDVVTGAFAVDRGDDVMVARELLGRAVDPAVLADEDTDLWDLVGDELAGLDEEVAR